ncbi:recombinase family protein [Pallidibacillus thermolactis]|jgi:DNA invertase Pin-like site-specific DNA recombinase|uniref:recombinase family protein n=1 Tax=Pallidibacillus thermolactis TaxID=251051 RepID=UPI0021D96485|nr:recombinase family protein [Pallidibacillus thermolactis]MCU9601776.1 recombinase family protein [Pallidibacillus thermolactis subsp. kokeshiiformis]
MKYGYARVSSTSQDLSVQIKQLEENNCDYIFKEKISGRNRDNRPEFNKLLETVKEGDTLVVTKLDRFARSTKDALNTIEYLNEKGVGLIVLNMGGDKIDTTTPIGKLLVTVLSGIAEFEADMIKERQMEGIALAKQRGVYKGRPKKYTENHKGLQYALKLFRERDKNKMTVNDICEITKISRATLYRANKEIL